VSEAVGVSDDGTVVMGVSRPDKIIGWRWDATSGMLALGNLGQVQYPETRPGAVSGDGTVIVGTSTIAGGGSRAFIWVDGAIHLLSTYLAQNGAVLRGRELLEASDITADGRALCGTTVDGEGFVAYLDDRAQGLGLLFSPLYPVLPGPPSADPGEKEIPLRAPKITGSNRIVTARPLVKLQGDVPGGTPVYVEFRINGGRPVRQRICGGVWQIRAKVPVGSSKLTFAFIGADGERSPESRAKVIRKS
jgi:probable HAF family extracellular repeat protein